MIITSEQDNETVKTTVKLSGRSRRILDLLSRKNRRSMSGEIEVWLDGIAQSDPVIRAALLEQAV